MKLPRVLPIVVLGLVLLATFGALAAAPSGPRFPQPQFESGYSSPFPTTPSPAPLLREWMDVLMLLICLVLASVLALRVRYRWAIVALSVFSLLYFGFWRKGCVCPVGATQNMALALTDRSYVPELSVVAFFVLPIFFALFFGRTFCAAVCPLGALQDLVIFRPLALPNWLLQSLGMLPYVSLGVAVLFAVNGAGFMVCRYDPFVGFFRLGGWSWPLVLGAMLLLLGMFMGRPYCRFFCPYGVLLGWASHVSWRHVSITPDECIRCRLCERACPFGAIRHPSSGTGGESRKVGVRRLVLVILLLPVLLLTGGWLSSHLGAVLARAHRVPRLAERIWLEETGQLKKLSVESEAFRTMGGSVDKLYGEAGDVLRRFERLGWYVGGFLALAYWFRLFSLSVYRTRADYEPDRGACVACGRCFAYCPKEIQRRRTRLQKALR